MLTLARFEAWDKIRQLPKPDPKYQYALGIWYYVQALADIQTDQINTAKIKLNQLQAIIKDGPIDKNLGSMGISLLQIGNRILEGLLANKAGNSRLMLKKLNQAIKIQDEISNNDPPSWYFPIRQLLGDALLNTHDYLKAKAVFLQDLKEHPNNGWSLYGLAKSLDHLEDKQQADKINLEFKKAWKYADNLTPISLFNSK